MLMKSWFTWKRIYLSKSVGRILATCLEKSEWIVDHVDAEIANVHDGVEPGLAEDYDPCQLVQENVMVER